MGHLFTNMTEYALKITVERQTVFPGADDTARGTDYSMIKRLALARDGNEITLSRDAGDRLHACLSEILSGIQ
jgi:hypothetical protein